MTKSTTEPTILVLATRNLDKAREIAQKLAERALPLAVKTLGDLEASGLAIEEVAETEPTLEGNALKKAKETLHALQSHGLVNVVVLADDTGLEVAALGGAPGVYSARYAEAEVGRKPTYAENVKKLLRAMASQADRSARFRTVIALVGSMQQPGQPDPVWVECTFEGVVEGRITHSARGEHGFGYDPIFEVSQLGKTFAELSLEEKNQFSHRALALEQALLYLQNRLAIASNDNLLQRA